MTITFKSKCTIALGELSMWNSFNFFMYLVFSFQTLSNAVAKWVLTCTFHVFLWRHTRFSDNRQNSFGTEKTMLSFSVIVTVEIHKLKVVPKIRVTQQITHYSSVVFRDIHCAHTAIQIHRSTEWLKRVVATNAVTPHVNTVLLSKLFLLVSAVTRGISYSNLIPRPNGKCHVTG